MHKWKLDSNPRYSPQLIISVNTDDAIIIWRGKPVLAFSKKLFVGKKGEKNPLKRVSARIWAATCFKKGILSILKYIKLVIPKILFILVLCKQRLLTPPPLHPKLEGVHAMSRYKPLVHRHSKKLLFKSASIVQSVH